MCDNTCVPMTETEAVHGAALGLTGNHTFPLFWASGAAEMAASMYLGCSLIAVQLEPQLSHL